MRYADSNKWLAVGYARETEDFSSLSSSSPLRSARLAREYETIAPFVISESETAKSRWKQKKKEKRKKTSDVSMSVKKYSAQQQSVFFHCRFIGRAFNVNFPPLLFCYSPLFEKIFLRKQRRKKLLSLPIRR